MPQFLDGIILMIIACIAIWLGRRWLNNEAAKEVNNTPKIEMAMCDKHGLIPASAMLHTTAVAIGRPDLKVDMCPICVQERTENVKRILAS